MEQTNIGGKDKVLIIATGGTIVSPQKNGKASPDAAATHELLGRVKEYLTSRGFEVTIRQPFGEAGMDSSRIGPTEWVKLANEIRRSQNDSLKGVIVVHGTDTMAYTAAWLSICFASLPLPIILTGSQQTPDETPFDGNVNLLGAARLVADGLDGVAIYFAGKLFSGFCAHKGHTEDFDAFRSLTLPSGSFHNALRGQAVTGYARSEAEPPNLEKILSLSEIEIAAATRKVGVCFVLPGCAPMLSGKEEILLIVGFGVGNMPSSYHAALIETFSGKRKPCIIACSQAQEGRVKAAIYKSVGIGELGSAGFTVFERNFSFEFATAAAYYAALCSGEPERTLAFLWTKR